MRYPDTRIRVRLLSEAIWDSGEQAANHVHTQALSDKNGLVFYHAKTFKGQLKRQAIWLHRLYRVAGEEKIASQFMETVAELFGWGKEEEKAHQISGVRWRTGMMRLGHLELPTNVRAKLLDLLQEDIDSEDRHNYRFSPQDLLEAQTYVRAMIQLDNQIVKERMFRLFHTVKEDLTFESKVEFEASPQLDHLEALLRIVCSLERIGAGVNRGRGKVKASLWINGHCVENLDELRRLYSLTTEKVIDSDMPGRISDHRRGRYYVLEIENEEPLKIGAVGSKSNLSEAAKQHIPGSTIRGAIIAELIKQRLFASEGRGTLSPEDVDILHHVYCQNGYLYKGDLLFTPTPQHLRMNKHQYREKKAVGEYVEVYDHGQDEKNAKDKNHLPHRYVSIRDGVFIPGKVNMFYRLHHSTVRKRDEHERENLYNYEAIAPGQTFRAILYDGGKYGDRLEKVLSPDRSQTWYLGGARSTGYGRCHVKVLARYDTYEQASELVGLQESRVANGNILTLTCLTDCLFRDAYGQPQAGVAKETIEQWLLEWLPETRKNPIGVKSQEVFLQTGMSEGYNSTWRARYPKESILMAGSVMRYELTQPLSEEQWMRLIREVESIPHGSRTQEGFGWLRVNVDYPADLATREPRNTTINTYTSSTIEQMSEDEKNTFEIIKEGLKQRRFIWLEAIADRLQKTSELYCHHLLKRGHLYRMLGRFQSWLKQNRIHNDWPPQDYSNQPDAYASYEKDAQQFALWDTHLEDLMAYLKGKENERIDRKASQYLSTIGKFHYEDNRIFIAELLTVGLYVASREWKEGQ